MMSQERDLSDNTNCGWQARLAKGDSDLHVHLIGIGGAGLSAIATVLLEMGITVSGSDRQSSANTDHLAEAGATIYPEQVAANLTVEDGSQPDIVLLSSAIDVDNQERQAAELIGLPVVKRSEFLPALLAERELLAVAGTHGKSTTTSMIVKILRDAGVDAGYIIGTHLPGYGNAAAGTSPYFVIEADEYDHMFLGLQPKVAVITNVEWDHPDCYPTPASFRRAFMQFIDAVDRRGMVVSCADDLGAEQVRTYHASRGAKWITYGAEEAADLRAEALAALPDGGVCANLIWWNAPLGQLELQAPGLHNIQNAMAALLVAGWCDVSMDEARRSLTTFRGTARRFELKGKCCGVTVIDDYAHHPTEVEATLAAARSSFPDARIWAVFQPHTFSRTQRMLYRMGDSFQDANRVIVTDIYAAREIDDGSVSAGELVAASDHPAICHLSGLETASDYLVERVADGDVVITLGAGDGYEIGEMLLEKLGDN
jgi:UDP-N-acetylmuramate--alanine ligase